MSSEIRIKEIKNRKKTIVINSNRKFVHAEKIKDIYFSFGEKDYKLVVCYYDKKWVPSVLRDLKEQKECKEADLNGVFNRILNSKHYRLIGIFEFSY